MKMMRLAIFDLDYTLWHPEMYQLSGPPKLVPITSTQGLSAAILKEAQTKYEGQILMDRNRPMRVFPGATFALTEINRLNQEGHDIRAAVASKTDEPDWARICMNHLVIDNERTITIADCFEHNLIEISYGSKAGHIERLHRKTGIPFEQMCFFDNEDWNIKDVSRALPAVKCFYTPNGMTRQSWEKAKAMFGMEIDNDSSNRSGGDGDAKRGSKTSKRKNARK